MARKLFVALEEENVDVVAPVADDVVEQQEESGEVAVIIDDLREDLDTLEESIQAGEDAEVTKDIVEDAVEKEEPLDATAATLVQESMNLLSSRTGIPNKRVVASLESYTGSRSERLHATKVTLEGIGQKLTDFWQSVKQFFSNLVFKVANFFKAIFSKRKALLDRVARLTGFVAKAVSVKEGAKISVPTAYAGAAELKKYVEGGKTTLTGLVTSFEAVDKAITAAKAAKEALSKSKTVADLEAFKTALTAIEEATKTVKGMDKLEGDTAAKKEVEVAAGDLSEIKATATILDEMAKAYEKGGATEAEVKADTATDSKDEAEMAEEVKADKGEKPATEADDGKASAMARVKAWWSYKRLTASAKTKVENEMYKTVQTCYVVTAKYVSTLKGAKE